jgi:hypothetical protein
MIIIGSLFCVLCYRWAMQSFEEGSVGWGYWHLFWSALNAALVLNRIF